MDTIVIGARFNGPPDSGNGGYSCGVVAAATGGDEVTLRLPPPLDVPLRVEGTSVYDGDRLVATAARLDLTWEPPPFPGYDTARAAEARYVGLHDHPFPTCFVCGPARSDGLGLRPGEVEPGYVATTWTPPEVVPDEYVWAALDCPSGWALIQSADSPVVLGRFGVCLVAPVEPREPHVVVARQRAPRDGRKHYSASAVYTADGTLTATGAATWIQLQSGGT